MELPEELRAPAPRDPAGASRLTSKSRASGRGTIVGGLIIMPIMIFLMWVEFGAIDALSIGLSVGVGGLVSLIGLALSLRVQRGPERGGFE